MTDKKQTKQEVLDEVIAEFFAMHEHVILIKSPKGKRNRSINGVAVRTDGLWYLLYNMELSWVVADLLKKRNTWDFVHNVADRASTIIKKQLVDRGRVESQDCWQIDYTLRPDKKYPRPVLRQIDPNNPPPIVADADKRWWDDYPRLDNSSENFNTENLRKDKEQFEGFIAMHRQIAKRVIAIAYKLNDGGELIFRPIDFRTRCIEIINGVPHSVLHCRIRGRANLNLDSIFRQCCDAITEGKAIFKWDKITIPHGKMVDESVSDAVLAPLVAVTDPMDKRWLANLKTALELFMERTHAVDAGGWSVLNTDHTHFYVDEENNEITIYVDFYTNFRWENVLHLAPLFKKSFESVNIEGMKIKRGKLEPYGSSKSSGMAKFTCVFKQ